MAEDKMKNGDRSCPESSEHKKDENAGEKAASALREGIAAGLSKEALDNLLWQAVIAFQGHRLYTASGLAFDYCVKRGQNGRYSGEMLISRRESSKPLTKSSILLAFHKVLPELLPADEGAALRRPLYAGPKAIGQIFGISYIYSLFWNMGLTRVPEKVEEKLRSGVIN